MRVDQKNASLFDKRVRQAIALTLDRPQIVKTLFNGNADLGNDSPFAPVYPSTAGRPAAPQGHPPKAKELIAAAGLSKGWKTKLVTYQTAELPSLAQIVKQARQGDRRQHRRQDPHGHAVLLGHADARRRGSTSR